MRSRRRSKRGLVEETSHVAVSDLRHGLVYKGQDWQPIIIQGGPADGAAAMIVWKPLKFGRRPWLVCPACGKPVGKLFGAQLTCRTCQHLDYRSQRNQPYQRSVARAQAIRKRLGQAHPWAGAPIPPPPPRMHLRTYVRLVKELRDHERRALNVIGPRVSRSVARLKAKFGL